MNDGADTMSQIGTASRRRLAMFASAASFAIAALVASNTFVPTLSQAKAAESQERNTPFPFNSQMEQFWRRFGMADPQSDKWWQEDFSFPRNSQMEQLFRRFGRADDARASRAWLGVQIQPVTVEIADSLGMKGHDGALVVEPQEGSPAAKAGILSGDVVTAVNGIAVTDAGDLTKMIGGMTPGASAKLSVWRKGEEKNISLTLGETPKSRDTRTGDSNSRPDGTDISSLGLTLEAAAKVAGSGPDGLVVTNVDPDGVASEHGVKTGDVILDVAGNKVAAPVDVNNAISDAQKNGKRTILMRLKSDAVTRFVALPITRT
jgi:C-terminal processing protease CtpA/Prc